MAILARRVVSALVKSCAVMGLVASMGTPASALIITSIEITNGIPSWLQVAELEAWAGATNVAAASNGGIASGTGDYSGTSTPDKANDGIVNTVYPQIYHSDGVGAGEKLTITLSGAFDVTTLTIFGRSDCCSDRDLFNYAVFIGATQVGSGVLDARNLNHSASVRLPAAPVVPEPASWALMIGGFGLAGALLRRRHNRGALTV